MNLSLDLALNDEPDIKIQQQEPLTMEISHSIVQTTSGKNNYCSLFIILLTVYIIAIIAHSNTKWTKNTQYPFFLHYTLGVFSIYHN